MCPVEEPVPCADLQKGWRKTRSRTQAVLSGLRGLVVAFGLVSRLSPQTAFLLGEGTAGQRGRGHPKQRSPPPLLRQRHCIQGRAGFRFC